MKNKTIQALFLKLQLEIEGLPASQIRQNALASLEATKVLTDLADADDRHNPPGKTVVRNTEGKVIGLQG